MATETIEEERARLADEIGCHPDELDEDIRLARITAEFYRNSYASLGPLMFCALERDGSIGIWPKDEEPGKPCRASGDTVTEALCELLARAAAQEGE